MKFVVTISDEVLDKFVSQDGDTISNLRNRLRSHVLSHLREQVTKVIAGDVTVVEFEVLRRYMGR